MMFLPTNLIDVFFHHSPVGLAIMRSDTRIIVAMNPAFSRMFGYDERELIGRTPDILIAPDEESNAAIIKKLVGEGPWEFERRYRRKDGSLLDGIMHARAFTTGDGELVYMVTIFDITRWKETQHNLELLESVVMRTQDMIVLTQPTGSDRFHPIVFTNPSFTKVTGYRFEDVVSKNIEMLFGPQTEPNVVKRLETDLKRFQQSRQELLIYGKDGREIWIDMVATPIRQRSQRGQVTHWIKVMRDISESKARLHQVLEERNRAQSANRAKSEFLANMSHELRTPLNAIIGFSEMIKVQAFGASSPRYAQYAADIHQSGHHLLSIISDILDMSKIEAGRYVLEEGEVDLCEVVTESLMFVRSKAQENEIALMNECVLDGVLVRADRRALKQVLTNILANAVKFTPRGGRVYTYTEYDDDQLYIIVADTGIGMPPELIERIGDKFLQAEPAYAKKYEGTGLGLSLAKELVELHAGKIHFQSKVDHGTVVKVSLPLSRLIVQAP